MFITTNSTIIYSENGTFKHVKLRIINMDNLIHLIPSVISSDVYDDSVSSRRIKWLRQLLMGSSHIASDTRPSIAELFTSVCLACFLGTFIQYSLCYCIKCKQLFSCDRGNTRLNSNSFCYTTNLFSYSFVINYLFRPKGIQTFSSTGKSSGFMRRIAVYSIFHKHIVYTSNAHFDGVLNYINIFS
jgi:hypothetical protein